MQLPVLLSSFYFPVVTNTGIIIQITTTATAMSTTTIKIDPAVI
jgi:hypothetical protein